MRCPTVRRRSGEHVVEFSLIAPMVFFLIVFLVVGGLGTFRYQEVAMMAREAARYGATHGAQYRKDAGLPPGSTADWTADISTHALSPWTSGLEPKSLSYAITWSTVAGQPGVPDNWPGATLTVTVSYQWFPEFFAVGPVFLTSSATATIAN